jgi:hypothetical protein
MLFFHAKVDVLAGPIHRESRRPIRSKFSMNHIIFLSDFCCESDGNQEEALSAPRNPDFTQGGDSLLEEMLGDEDTLIQLGDEALDLLLSGFHHRKQRVRSTAVTLLSELFPGEQTFSLFRNALLDHKEKREFRFHVARHMVHSDRDGVESIIKAFRISRGCNDRICAAFLMGGSTNRSHIFDLLNFLEDSNDCVVVAAFLSLMRHPIMSVQTPLRRFLKGAESFQLKLLLKNINYYNDTLHFPVVSQLLSHRLEALKQQKVAYHPEYYEQSYSQERLSKLDRIASSKPDSVEQEDFGLFEI